MPFRSVYKPEDLAMLTRVLEEHCKQHGITSMEARESVAASLLTHYTGGASDERELATILSDEDRPR